MVCFFLHVKGTSAPSRNALVTLVSLCALAGALVFSTAAQAETCPNEQLRAEDHSTSLPDCRAYELVTPPFKEDAQTGLETWFAVPALTGMSADGSHLIVPSTGNFGEDNGAPGANSYELTRTASGWSETDIDLPVSRFPASTIALAEQHVAESDQKGSSLLGSEPLQASPDFGMFLYHSPNGGEEFASGSFWIGEADGAPHRIGPGEGIFKGASRDLSHVLYQVGGSYVGGGILEEERYVAGQESAPAPVGVDPSGELCPTATYISPGGTGMTGGMSADGSVVFFSVPAAGCAAGDPAVSEIYARVEESRTVALSEPDKEDCSACDMSPTVQAPVEGIDGASADGSKVFFTTSQPLLGSETETSANIYEYDFDAPAASPEHPDGRIVRVTGGEWGPGGAQVQGNQIIVSEDGSHVYFVAAGKLEGAKNSRGKEAVENESNLYVFDTETGTTSFIATAAFGPHWSTTPDGRFFVFTSSTPELTEDDTSTARQVFEYDAQTGELVRVSIGQDGFNDNGNTDTFAAVIPPGERSNAVFNQEYMQPLVVSDNGAYVAFESSDGLTPAALNDHLVELPFEIKYGNGAETYHGILKYYAENVYEYHDGNVYLISDGQDTSYSRRSGEGGSSTAYANGSSSVMLRGVSPSGEDIFFETADQLVSQDVDTQVDLYDAHIDGGFPAPLSLLPTCTGDACQGPLSPAPTLLSPGSEFQAGETPPLVTPAPVATIKPKPKAKACKKGYVEKDGKCVKKPKAKKAKAKKASRDRRASR